MDGQKEATNQPIEQDKSISKWQQRITLFLFWVAFLSLLAMSIPHVAWLYQTYEPHDGNWYTTGTSYGVAIAIDVMIAWLSWAQVAGKGARSNVTWLFIASLSALSWYANYLYGMNNDPIHQSDIWNISIAFGWTTTGYITPVIISAVPVFSLAYTAMLHTVMNQNVETVAEMQARLAELQARKKVEEELKKVEGGSLIKRLTIGAVKSGFETVSEVKKIAQESQLSEAVNDDASASDPSLDEDVYVVEDEEDFEGENVLVDTGENEAINHIDATLFVVEDEEEETSKTSATPSTSRRSTGKLSVTIKEAATQLNLSEAYIRELRDNKKLHSPGRNKKLILMSSIKTFEENRQKRSRKNQDEPVEVQQEQHQNGNGNGHDKDDLRIFDMPILATE